MKKLNLVLVLIGFFLLSYVGAGVCVSLSNIQISPASPKDMQFGEQVEVTFDYYTAVFGNWNWKLATDIDDAHNYLNGKGAYSTPVLDARVTAVWTGTKISFYIFSCKGTGGRFFGNWAWKRSESASDVHNFINGLGSYQNPVKDAEITAVYTGTQTLFYVFYRTGTEDCLFGNWAWKRSDSASDAHDFLNGKGAYQNPVRDARIVSVWDGAKTVFYIFYQNGTGGRLFGGWAWKLAQDISDAHNFINGLSSYQNPVKDAEISAVSDGSKNLFHVFYKSKTDGDGLRIFVRPITNGTTTPSFSGHGSPLYPLGNYSGSGWFTINSGEVTVDSVRIQVKNADQSTTIMEKFIPVAYHFSSGTAVASSPIELDHPDSYLLKQNHPNPFNPTTTIRYEVPQPGNIKLSVFDIQGREVRTLVDHESPAGSFDVTWDGRDDQAMNVASGVYLYRLETQNLVLTKKMILLQ
ncbi:MAG: T9SS type A sorting domain-containing protein [bacterium]|nr:T9SS type A sorting domain-containing protein [bacterium]